MIREILLIAAVISCFAGCASPRVAGVAETMALREPPVIEPAEVRKEVPKSEEIPQPRETELFSLSFRDADVRDVLLILSKFSGVNIIADRDVSGKISVDFSGLDLNSALYAITGQLGFTFRADKGFIRVSRPVLESRTFRMNYMSGRRSSTSSMSASISAAGSTGGIAGSATNINITSGTPSAASGAQATAQGGQGNVNITTSGTSDLWDEVRRGLEVIIFGDSRGGGSSSGGYSRGDEKTGKKLVISEMAGLLAITDYSDNMARVSDFLEDVDRAVRKQVMIQAHIVEITLNDGYKFGLDWKLLTGSGEGGQNELFSFSQNLVVNPATGIFQIDLSGRKIDALLDAMKEQGHVNVLSSPKVSTMSNQRAVIKLTTKEVSWVTNSFLNADGTVVLSYTSPQIDEVGLFLDVTPHIDDYGTITMQIHPSVSEKVRDSVSPDQKSTKPIIGIREVDTVIKVRNGQTIVIAGLITDKVSDSTARVPVLGDVPVIGTLFKQTVQEKRKSELVILLTPFVLTDRSIEDIRIEHEERLIKAGRVLEYVPQLKKGMSAQGAQPDRN